MGCEFVLNKVVLWMDHGTFRRVVNVLTGFKRLYVKETSDRLLTSLREGDVRPTFDVSTWRRRPTDFWRLYVKGTSEWLLTSLREGDVRPTFDVSTWRRRPTDFWRLYVKETSDRLLTSLREGDVRMAFNVSARGDVRLWASLRDWVWTSRRRIRVSTEFERFDVKWTFDRD